jgi:trans-aconitate methyltransferase
MAFTLAHRTYARLLRMAGLQARGWDEQFRVAPGYYGQRSPETVRHVERLCAGGALLEFGCGEGDLPHALLPGTYSSYIGQDISRIAVERAQQRADRAGLTCTRFEHGDMAQWPGASGISLIVAEECLYYLPARTMRRFLGRCMDALSDGGSLLVIVHSAEKHASTLEACREVCHVATDLRSGGRVFLTLRPKHAARRRDTIHPPGAS